MLFTISRNVLTRAECEKKVRVTSLVRARGAQGIWTPAEIFPRLASYRRTRGNRKAPFFRPSWKRYLGQDMKALTVSNKRVGQPLPRNRESGTLV